MPIKNLSFWRISNEIVLGLGLFTPWISFNLDAQSIPPEFTPGWRFILITLQGLWEDVLINGFDLNMWPFWLLGLSEVLIVFYTIINLYSIIRKQTCRGAKVLSLVLVSISGILIFPAFLGHPMIGYWLINLGLLSSAVFEWQNTKTR